MIVDNIIGRVEDLEGAVCELDAVTLTSEQRESGHFKTKSAHGREIAVSLPRGSELQDGDVLLREEGIAVVARAAEEDVIEVSPQTPLDWGVVGYQLGNLHRRVRFLPDAMLTPFDEGAQQTLQRLGVPHRRARRPFVGKRYRALGGHGHV